MKSHVATVLDVVNGIIDDAIRVWRDDTKALGKDLSYLRRASEERGLAFFTLTLPALGKVLDKALDRGYLDTSIFPQGITLVHGRPELFGSLFKRVFTLSGELRQKPDATAVAYLREVCYFAKRLRYPCSPRATKETLDEFFAIEDGLPAPWAGTWDEFIPTWRTRGGHPLWGDSPRDHSSQQLTFLDAIPTGDLPWDNLRSLCRRVISSLGTPDWWELLPKHGPGVVSERGGFISKYEMPNWPRRLGSMFAYDWFGTGIIGTIPMSEDEPTSRLIAVPKTQKGPRLICAEPLAHQWMQQGIWRWLEEQCKSNVLGRCIDFRGQESSRLLALDSSIGGKRATIDLSSASDRLSCRLVEYVFQGSEILDGMHACRTRYLKQTISSCHPKVIKMKKFAPMGSALTFPVQTIVYACLSAFALRVAEDRSDDWTNWKIDFERIRVFGDDIIVPNHAYNAVISVLTECGLKVNLSKSYAGGHFRESCGMDGFQGVDVTPAYLLEPYDGSATSMAATIEASNNFHKRGFWKTADVIANFIPPKERKLLEVVGGEDSGLGLFSYLGGHWDHLPLRWNSALQRREYVALKVTSKVTKVQGTGNSGLTQYFTERPDQSFDWSAGQVGRVRLRKGRTRVYD